MGEDFENLRSSDGIAELVEWYCRNLVRRIRVYSPYRILVGRICYGY
ncbi:MAG: hypothetical protein M1493_04995 [Firmicutes bacterium]|nr:hypothetical protein [Bacillota bacterium]